MSKLGKVLRKNIREQDATQANISKRVSQLMQTMPTRKMVYDQLKKEFPDAPDSLVMQTVYGMRRGAKIEGTPPEKRAPIDNSPYSPTDDDNTDDLPSWHDTDQERTNEMDYNPKEPEWVKAHQRRIARQNAKMHPAMAGVMGGGSPEDSKKWLAADREFKKQQKSTKEDASMKLSEDRRKGEVWQTKDGWGAKDQRGNVRYFRGREYARNWSKNTDSFYDTHKGPEGYNYGKATRTRSTVNQRKLAKEDEATKLSEASYNKTVSLGKFLDICRNKGWRIGYRGKSYSPNAAPDFYGSATKGLVLKGKQDAGGSWDQRKGTWEIIDSGDELKVKLVLEHKTEGIAMKLEEFRTLIKEEVKQAIAERRLVRAEVRKAIAEALPKLGSGQRFKNLVKKLSAKKEEATTVQPQETVTEGKRAVRKESKKALKKESKRAVRKESKKTIRKESKKPKPTMQEQAKVNLIRKRVHEVLMQEMTRALSEAKANNPKALAAWIGRKKFGKGKFQKMAAAGKK